MNRLLLRQLGFGVLVVFLFISGIEIASDALSLLDKIFLGGPNRFATWLVTADDYRSQPWVREYYQEHCDAWQAD